MYRTGMLAMVGLLSVLPLSAQPPKAPESLPMPVAAPGAPAGGAPGNVMQIPFQGHVHISTFYHAAEVERAHPAIMQVLRDNGYSGVRIEKGSVHGSRETGAICVITLPFRSGVHVILMGADDDQNALVSRIEKIQDSLSKPPKEILPVKAEESPETVKSPNRRVIVWGMESRPATKMLKLALPAAAISIEKSGLTSFPSPRPNMILGCDNDRAAGLLLMPANNEVDCTFITITTTRDEKEAERLQALLLKNWTRILFE